MSLPHHHLLISQVTCFLHHWGLQMLLLLLSFIYVGSYSQQSYLYLNPPSNHNSSTFTTQGLHSCSPHGIFWYQWLIHTHKHLCTQTHKNTYAETCIHKHTHINIYTYTQFLPILNNSGYHIYKDPIICTRSSEYIL